MPEFIALLRGVNVGGRRRVPMAAHRGLCGDLGFRNARTFIQSGNLVFEAAGGAAAVRVRLEEGMEERFGFAVPSVVVPATAWRRLLAANPFPRESAEAPDRVAVVLTGDPPPAGAAVELQARGTLGERAAAAGGAVWIHYPGGIGRSRVGPALLDRVLGAPATVRNVRTAAALGDLLGG